MAHSTLRGTSGVIIAGWTIGAGICLRHDLHRTDDCGRPSEGCHNEFILFHNMSPFCCFIFTPTLQVTGPIYTLEPLVIMKKKPRWNYFCATLLLGTSRFLSKSPPAFQILKTSANPVFFYPSRSILIDGEGLGGVALSFRDVRWFVDRDVCLQVPLSIILSPRFAGGTRKPEALGCWMRLKWPTPSRLEMV